MSDQFVQCPYCMYKAIPSTVKRHLVGESKDKSIAAGTTKYCWQKAIAEPVERAAFLATVEGMIGTRKRRSKIIHGSAEPESTIYGETLLTEFDDYGEAVGVTDETSATMYGAIAMDSGNDHTSDSVSDDGCIILDETEIGEDAAELETEKDNFTEDYDVCREEAEEMKLHRAATVAGNDATLTVVLSIGESYDLAAIEVFKKRLSKKDQLLLLSGFMDGANEDLIWGENVLRKDLLTLRNQCWLNDEVMNYAVVKLQQQVLECKLIAYN